MLREQFELLHFEPLSSRTVVDVYTTWSERDKGMVPMVQDIYRAHGWPDLDRYRKKECLEAVQAALEEHYPDHADDRE